MKCLTPGCGSTALTVHPETGLCDACMILKLEEELISTKIDYSMAMARADAEERDAADQTIRADDAEHELRNAETRIKELESAAKAA
jgi:hypothetical protein